MTVAELWESAAKVRGDLEQARSIELALENKVGRSAGVLGEAQRYHKNLCERHTILMAQVSRLRERLAGLYEEIFIAKQHESETKAG